MRYEYIILNMTRNGPTKSWEEIAEDALNAYGNQGFKLISVEYQRAYLMREVDA